MSSSREDIKKLESEVMLRLSEKRFQHTLGVCRAATEICELCGFDFVNEAQCAALLHDIAKEYPKSELISMISAEGFSLDEEDILSDGVLHSFAAVYVIKHDFPDFATKDILSAVYNHTVGAPDMSLFDEVIFLSDFIEDTRRHAPCIELRKYFFDNAKRGAFSENIKLLHDASARSIDHTLKSLNDRNLPINSKCILTRNALLSKI